VKERRKAREIVLQALYAWEVGGSPIRETLGQLCKERIAAETADYAEQLASRVEEHRERLDAYIADQTANWRLDRFAAVDRNILRMAIAEMLFMEDVPAKVSIDEAIELAKKYSTEKSGKFVNGILDPIAKGKVKKL
jgi:N utilization substance protein B